MHGYHSVHQKKKKEVEDQSVIGCVEVRGSVSAAVEFKSSGKRKGEDRRVFIRRAGGVETTGAEREAGLELTGPSGNETENGGVQEETGRGEAGEIKY